MNMIARFPAIVVAAGLAMSTGAFAQAMTGDSGTTPSIENGALIPAGLIVWLLGISAILSAGLFTFVDRKMRSGKTAI